jgi:hypothetical protein
MKSLRPVLIVAMVAINALLLLSLATRGSGSASPSFLETATAANAAQVARPGDYVMIAGEVNNIPADVVYIIDTANGGVIGVTYNNNQGRLEALAPLNLQRVIEGN